MLEKIGTNCYPITNTIMVPTTVNRTTVYDDTDTSISIGVNKQKNDFTLKNNNLTPHDPLVTNDFEVSETIDHNQQGVPLIKTGFKRNLPMYNQDDDDLDPRKVNRISVHDTYVNQLNDCNMLNVDTRRNIQNNKQRMISPQSVLHQNLSECIKCLCQQMEKNSIPQVTCDTINTNTIANSNTTSSTICSQALDLRMTSPLIVDESPINETWNTSGMLIKALSPSSPLLPSFSSSASSSSSSSCSNNILQQQQQQQRKQQLHYHHECDQHDKVVNLMPTKSSEHFNDTLMNISSYNQYNNYTISSCSPNLAMMDTIPFSLSKMDSSFVSNKLFSNTSSISTLTNTHTQHNLKTQAPLFPRLSSTLLSLSSSDTTTEDSKTVLQTPIKEEIFYKLSEALCLHRSGSQLSLNDNGINDQLMTSDLLNPTEFIWNYAKNYALFTKNNSSENVIEVNKTVEDSSTCPVSETKSNDLENETSSKSEFTDTEKCDSKSTSLWFTESELHSIPNLMESIRKFCSNNECGYEACRSSRLREHYHCGVCNKILLRREEMIRHAKWHKKREESMQYGFMRYSPGDDCTVSACPHNGRQTHYHCMQSNCYKVYISTSDVQMHANYHRKDAVIIQEGFQRFRATENCGIPRCLFYTEHTTHFHCRRSNCHFTFKNKADMEKHKLHHQKNDRFAQDGFRRYIKCENCDFPECQYSGVINHIHCIRPGCDYVVHSSSQIMSHKRKHDRRFASFSPRHMGVVCRDDISQTLSSSNQGNDNDDEDIANTGGAGIDGDMYTVSTTTDVLKAKQNLLSSGKYIKDLGENEISLLQNNNLDFGFFSNKNTYPYEVDFNMIEPMSITNLLTEVSKLASLCICRRQHWGELSYDCDNNTNEKCINKDQENSPLCAKIDKILQSIYKSYNHHSSQCLWPDCPSKTNEIDLKQTQESPRTWCKYWLSHLWEACLSFFAYIECDQSNCSMRSRGSHTHCRFWPKCDFINPSGSSNFQVLYEHLFLHNECFAPKLISSSISNQSTCRRNESSDNLVYDASYNIANSRRRGRPPKYTKYVHVPHINPPENLHKDDNYHSDLCYSMFFDQSESRFECQNQTVNENHSISVVDNLHNKHESNQFKNIRLGVKLFLCGEICPDSKCPYFSTHEEHYHCTKPRCYMATNSLDLMNTHRREFHQYTVIEQGFEYFDTSIDCRRPLCHNNKVHKHFHCVYPSCDYTFVRASTMQQHTKKHTVNLKSSQDITTKSHYTASLENKSAKISTSTLMSNSQLDGNLPLSKVSNSETNSQDSNKSIDLLTTPISVTEVNPVLSLLPLGIHPRQLPVLLPNTQNQNLSLPSIPMDNNLTRIKCVENSLLPGFLPIWAAAMVTAATMTTGLGNSMPRINYEPRIMGECISDINCFSLPLNQPIKMYMHPDDHLPVTTGQNGVQV